MIFEALWESAQRGELILVENGFCHYHLRRDGQLTIHEIISLRRGAGSRMLAQLRHIGARCIVAKCPTDLDSNAWYERNGFVRVRMEQTKTGRWVNTWKLVP